MPSLKVSNMHANAARLVERAKDTTSGTFIYIGWDGKSISAGDKIRRSLPHIRVDVAKGETEVEIETKMAMAVVQLQQSLPPALAKWKTPAPPRSGAASLLAKKGLYASRKGKR